MKHKKKEKQMAEYSVVELQTMSRDLARELFELRNTLALQRKLEKPHLLKAKKKDRARVLAMLTKKQKEGVAV